MAATLSRATLSALPSGVAAPSYDPSRLSAGIVHIGVGNFHRAHQAVYLDRLFSSGRDLDWALVGAGVRAADARTRAALAAQDWLWTVVEQSATRSEARIVAPMVDFVDPTDPSALVARLCDPKIRIASLTVTEGGYFIDPGRGVFNPSHPDIAADAAAPDAPRTAFGVILKALRLRRDAGAPPFTVMSCDNLPGNGAIARAAVLGLAARAAPDLVAWIEDNVAFPNGMVDRITPATGEKERRAIVETFGLADAAPVFCEDFAQWVLEDRFSAGRPALEDAGVEFADDIEPFELMKLRILNGGHAAIAYPSALLDVTYAHEAMATPLIAGFLDKLERTEVLPAVAAPPGADTASYLGRVQTRFANPKIEDTIARLAQDGSNRQPKFILPSVADRLAEGASIAGLALVSALWRRFLEGASESGAPLPLEDPQGPRLRDAALRSRDDPLVFLELRDIYGDLAASEAFRAAFAAASRAVVEKGVEGALRRYLSEAA